MKWHLLAATGAAAFLATPVPARDLPDTAAAAAAFGARESVQSIAISPDGQHLVYVAPSRGQGAVLFVVDLAPADQTPRRITAADGVQQRLGGCDFVSNQRLVCTIWTIATLNGNLVPISRLVAMNTDGSNLKQLGENDSVYQTYVRLDSGRVIDWLPGTDGQVLMTQSFVPEARMGTRLYRTREGVGVVRVDTATLRNEAVVQPRDDADGFISDGEGHVRIMSTHSTRSASGQLSPITTFFHRSAAGGDWRQLGTYDTSTSQGLIPVAVDSSLDVAYLFEKLNGRDALYRMKLDGTGARELVASHPQVDIDGLLRIGRRNRVVGASFATDRREVIYFDPALRQLSEQLHRALPNLPLIRFVDASEDEQRLLIWAGSDNDPGRYFTYDKATRRLNEILLARAALEDVPLATVRAISYRAADGTMVPGYLTLPPGSNGRGLPAIVMPHGGPAARDEWGFDWLAQYFANRGYAVLQPNFRGSSGYGDGWFRKNGFVSWRTAVGDVVDAGRYLTAEGIADPARLAIFGWSYGGYAALQSEVIDGGLFKAVVAVAPVTDLDIARNEWRDFTNNALVRDYFGQGPHIREGSPAQNIAAFHAPVLMFHGTLDRNVGIRQSQVMDQRLRAGGRTSELVTYPGLDHQLDDSAARTDMLSRSDAFLRQALGIR